MRSARLAVAAVLVLALGAAYWLTRDDRSVAAADHVREQRLGELLPAVGRTAPPLVARTISGETVDLRNLRGRPVWVTFGASWCPPCRAEAPDIADLIAEHAGDRLAVVSIYLGEDADTVTGFTDRLGLDYPSVADPDRVLGALYGVRGLPSHFFIAPDGTISSVRISSLSRDQMEAEVAALLG
jgi:cytochrome c biogenesis protein CcmG, thiol:disulfide interchange protein DsbE